MLRRWEPPGPYLTRGASAYPGPMNRLLARALVKAAGLAERKKLQTRSLVMQPKAASAMPGRSEKVVFSENLRGTLPNAKELRQQEDRGALAGMRNAATAVDRLPGHADVGWIIGRIITSALDTVPGLMTSALSAIDPGRCGDVDPLTTGPSQTALDEVRRRLAKVLGTDDVGPVQNETCSSPIRAGLLYRWAQLAKDPAAESCRWLWEGAPGGLEEMPEHIDGIFPKADPDQDVSDPSEVCLAAEDFNQLPGLRSRRGSAH
jgi:hypothetical protein